MSDVNELIDRMEKLTRADSQEEWEKVRSEAIDVLRGSESLSQQQYRRIHSAAIALMLDGIR